MLYYAIYKNEELVGIGNTRCPKIPENCKFFTYKKLTEKSYNKLNADICKAAIS